MHAQKINNHYANIIKWIEHIKCDYDDFNAVMEQQGEKEIIRKEIGIKSIKSQICPLLINFLHTMNTTLKNVASVWLSPDAKTKNDINYVHSSAKSIVQDITPINTFNIGSNRRLVRAKWEIKIKQKRRKGLDVELVRENKERYTSEL